MNTLKSNKRQETNIRKSPIVKLKENLEKLRLKNAEDELIIKKQNDEIAKLKSLIAAKSVPLPNNSKASQLQAEVENQLQKKRDLRHKLDVVSSEREKLHIAISEINILKEKIRDLKVKIQKNDAKFVQKQSHYQALLKEKEEAIQQQRLKREGMLKAYQLELEQVGKEVILREDKSPKKLTKKPELNLDLLIEQALKEFEQEQHNYPPQPPHQFFSNNSQALRSSSLRSVNQQWYSSKYMPIDAISWPVPELLPNLKRAATISALTL